MSKRKTHICYYSKALMHLCKIYILKCENYYIKNVHMCVNIFDISFILYKMILVYDTKRSISVFNIISSEFVLSFIHIISYCQTD